MTASTRAVRATPAERQAPDHEVVVVGAGFGGIGAGIADTDRVNLPRTLPIVQPSVNWVRVAQRFPVRIRLEEPADRLVRVGASAIVEIKHGAACR